MKRMLHEVIADVSNSKLTGLLSMMVLKDKSNLLKIYFKNGSIYRMSYLKLKDIDCLSNIHLIEFSECNFIPGAKLETEPSDLPSTDDIIHYLQTKDINVECRQFGEGTSAAKTGKTSSEPFERIKEGIMAALMKQIGPVGKKVGNQTVAKWQIANAPTRDGIHQLIILLSSEIDDKENRNEFIEEAMRIIS
ncbi:MAG: hypothetical protein CVV37_03840 [Nitrospira bacterium HGW-Nitrospira-1]|nr:MAG: hypothetical protein CVV37_03840 [Nitrospira bacterium HGW-Nitrospira-1]